MVGAAKRTITWNDDREPAISNQLEDLLMIEEQVHVAHHDLFQDGQRSSSSQVRQSYCISFTHEFLCSFHRNKTLWWNL